MDVTFFGSSSELRAWLADHHDTAKELQIGFYKKSSGIGGITYQEALDEALCFGWIDGVRNRLDDVSYTTRFTPRTKRSIWSAVNIARVGELTKLGRMEPPGLAAFQNRDPTRTNLYASEQTSVAFDSAYEAQFRAHQQAWDFFQAQAPSYRRVATHWVMSAKKEETRLRRLATLIEDSASGRRIGPLTRPTKG